MSLIFHFGTSKPQNVPKVLLINYQFQPRFSYEVCKFLKKVQINIATDKYYTFIEMDLTTKRC